MLKNRIVTVAVSLITVLFITYPTPGQFTLFVDYTVSESAQLAQEAAFTAQVGVLPLVDFDDLPAGPVVGDEWSASGLVVSDPGVGSVFQLLPADAFATPYSSPNALQEVTGAGFEIEVSPPRSAIGFWFIDSEFTEAGEFIAFFDAAGVEITSIPMPATGFPTSTPEGNFFIGIESTIPIARILINELTNDNEGVGIDDFMIGPVGPPGPVIEMREPWPRDDGVLTNDTAIDTFRLLFDEAIVFTDTDLTITDRFGASVPFVVSVSNSPFMLISFGVPLLHDDYTITIADTVVGAVSGQPIDGDNDGAAGGNAVIVMKHRRRVDTNDDFSVNVDDLISLLAAWGAP